MIKTKMPMLTLICVSVISIITIIAAFIDYRNKLNDKQEQLNTERKRADQYKNIIEKSNSILVKTNTILEKNIELQKIQTETLQNVIGNGIPKLYIVVTGVNIHINIINDEDYPVKNVEVKLERVTYDYFVPDKDGNGSRSENPNAFVEKEIKFGDLQNKKTKSLYEERFPFEYKDFLYIYRVTWQNGNYTGGFHYKNKEKAEITDQNITMYSDNMDLKDAVWINGEYSKAVKYKK